MRPPPRLTAPVAARHGLLAALLVAASLTACSGDDAAEPDVAVTLPPGALAEQVLQPDDVPDGLIPLLAQTGPADITRIAGFSADTTAAEASLREHGFDDAYVVQYGDQQSGRFIVNVVATFDTEDGATADLTADLDAARRSGVPFPVDDLGDQAGGVRGATATTTASPAPTRSADDFDLVTVRWRQGNRTWLLAVGARGTVEQAAVVKLARLVLSRADS